VKYFSMVIMEKNVSDNGEKNGSDAIIVIMRW
jgi:hypothetical protein